MRTPEAGGVASSAGDVPRRVGLRHDDDWPFSQRPSPSALYFYFHSQDVEPATQSLVSVTYTMGSTQIDLAELPAMKSNPKVQLLNRLGYLLY